MSNKGLTANNPRRVDTRDEVENCFINERIVFVSGCEVTISPAHSQAREWGECRSSPAKRKKEIPLYYRSTPFYILCPPRLSSASPQKNTVTGVANERRSRWSGAKAEVLPKIKRRGDRHRALRRDSAGRLPRAGARPLPLRPAVRNRRPRTCRCACRQRPAHAR